MILTPHQEAKKDEVIDLLKKGERRIVLSGSAGVGKTVLVGALVEELSKDGVHHVYEKTDKYGNKIETHKQIGGWLRPTSNGLIYVTAPTNKALSVLNKKIEASQRIVSATIHRACKLKKYDDPKTGERKFVRLKSGRNDPFEPSKIAFIDESSMLNTAFVGTTPEIRERYRREDKEELIVDGYLEEYSFPIIFIGDEKQLNPVGEPYSPAFHWDWPVVELTEIIRQGEGNPIIELSRDLDLIYFKRPKIFPISNGTETISKLNGYLYSNKVSSIIDNLAMVNGTDELKYLAYTNKTVDSMNIQVRNRRYGNPRKLELEETVVFNSPFDSFYTNQEVKVEELEEYEDNIRVPTEESIFDYESKPVNDKFEKVKMKLYNVNNAFTVIHEDSEATYKRIYKELSQNCAKLGWDYRGRAWFADQFADIKYNHSLTVHKSQGSTYKETILNIMDIGFCRSDEEKQRLLYTAVTRASNLVILNNVK